MHNYAPDAIFDMIGANVKSVPAVFTPKRGMVLDLFTFLRTINQRLLNLEKAPTTLHKQLNFTQVLKC